MVRVVVMGVSGSGKTSVGAALADRLQLPFVEGDSLHPQSNVARMAAGIPLSDADRWPWLDQIGDRLAQAPGGVVISCSALKKAYRERLRAAAAPLYFIFLDGAFDVLSTRMASRKGHFMPVSLLESQLATLETPVGEPLVHRIDAALPVERIVAESADWLAAQSKA